MADQQVPLMEMSLEDFNKSLPELYKQGVDTDFLMREYARLNPYTPPKETQGYAEGGLVSPNAMSDYFRAASGQMSEMEFVGKHKMSTLEFENRFEEENNVDISGVETFKDIVRTVPRR